MLLPSIGKLFLDTPDNLSNNRIYVARLFPLFMRTYPRHLRYRDRAMLCHRTWLLFSSQLGCLFDICRANTGPYQSRSAYHLPQGTAPAASTYSLHSYPNRERPPSPTPSVMSSTSQHTTHSQYSTLRPGYQPQQNSYRPGTVYQSTTYQNQSQPTYQTQASYSRPRYQSTSYQSPYQPTSF